MKPTLLTAEQTDGRNLSFVSIVGGSDQPQSCAGSRYLWSGCIVAAQLGFRTQFRQLLCSLSPSKCLFTSADTHTDLCFSTIEGGSAAARGEDAGRARMMMVGGSGVVGRMCQCSPWTELETWVKRSESQKQIGPEGLGSQKLGKESWGGGRLFIPTPSLGILWPSGF